MIGIAFTLFDTGIGRCGIAWRGDKVVGLHLPEARDAATEARMLRRVGGAAAPGTPDGPIADAIARIVALLRGAPSDLDPIVLDMDAVPEFDRRVYAVARKVPPGATTTYGAIAAEVGDPRDARAVGQALGQNPFPIVVPCHRVLGADGKLGGFSANGGRETKLRMLAIEGAAIGPAEAAGTGSLFDDLPLAVAPARRR
jgi:methylated-DNA-[protein]-cysteine S-methyltransferase